MNRTKTMRWAALAALWAMSGCSSCEKAASNDPSQFVARSAEGVLEITDIGAVAKNADQIRGLLDGIVTPGQLKGLEAEMTRMLGFDPTTPEGLAAAGLAAGGKATVQLVNGGRRALWIVPVQDATKFNATIKKLVEGRRRIDDTATVKAGSTPITVLSTSWGDQKIPLASVANQGKFGFVGVGRDATNLIKNALALKRSQSVLAHPEYAAQAKVLGTKSLARFIVPTATVTAARVARESRLGEGRAAELAGTMTSIGWSLNLDGRDIKLDGRLRFNEKSRKDLQKILEKKGAAPAGVRAVPEDSVIVLDLAGDSKALLDVIAPAGSDLRNRLAGNLARLKSEGGLDVEKDFLPHLSGHAALTVGVNDLSGLSNLRALMRNPVAVLWIAAAFGVTSRDVENALTKAYPQMDPALDRNGLVRRERKTAGMAITSVAIAAADPAHGTVIESAFSKDSWIVSNETKATNSIASSIANAPAERLGKGGGRLEIRFKPLAEAARTVDIGRLAGTGASALMARAMIAKGLLILDRFETFEGKLELAPDGLALHGMLRLAKPSKAQ